MRSVNIHAAKTHLLRLVEDVARGEEILIARAGKPLAKLVPLAPAEPPRRDLDSFAGRVTPEQWEAFDRTINDDKSLDREIEAEFYGEDPPR